MLKYNILFATIFLLLLGCGRRNIPSMPKAPPIIDGSVLDEMLAQAEAARRDSLLAAKVRLIASIRRTGCRGQCPAYEAKVFSNDSVSYNGIVFVEREGLYEAQADSAWTKAILDKAFKINYFELRDTYPESGKLILDLPSVITSLHLNTTEKTIKNNYDAPEALTEFEAFFEAQLEQLRWSKVYR